MSVQTMCDIGLLLLLGGLKNKRIVDDRWNGVNFDNVAGSNLLIQAASEYLSCADEQEQTGDGALWILLENNFADSYSVFRNDKSGVSKTISTPIVAVKLSNKSFNVTFVGDNNRSTYTPRFHIPDGKENPVVGDEGFIRNFFVGELHEKITFI